MAIFTKVSPVYKTRERRRLVLADFEKRGAFYNSKSLLFSGRFWLNRRIFTAAGWSWDLRKNNTKPKSRKKVIALLVWLIIFGLVFGLVMPDSGGAISSCRSGLLLNDRSKGQKAREKTRTKPTKNQQKGWFFTDLTCCGQTRKSTRGTAKT